MEAPESRPARAGLPRSGSKLPLSVLRFLLVCAILVLSAELLCGVVFGLGKPVLLRADPDCGYLPAPNQHVLRFFARNDINAFGMRSADVSPAKPPGTLRVLFIGDSVAYGTTYIDQSDIFTGLLSRELPSRVGRRTEVLDAAAGGWAVGNEVGYLESRGTFGADQVIFVLNTGDLDQPFNRIEFSLAQGTADRAPPGALYELWVRYVRPRLTGTPAAADAGSAPESPGASGQRSLDVLTQLELARLFSARAGARFGIIYSPARGGEWESPDYARRLAALKAWAAAHDVPLLDLSASYSVHTPSEVYQPGGVHLTQYGNRIAADAIEAHWVWLVSRTAPLR